MKSIKKNLAIATLALATLMASSSAFALIKIQCGPGGAALIYTINSSGVVTGTSWVAQHAYCV